MQAHNRITAAAASTGNLTLSGAQAIDGVSCIAGSIVLVKNQSTGSQNGVYTCAASTWSRVTVYGYDVVTVSAGTVNAATQWVLTNAPGMVIGTDTLTFLELVDMEDPCSGRTPCYTFPVSTTAATVVACPNLYLTVKHTGLLSDGSTAAATGDDQVIMHADATMVASHARGVKIPIELSESWEIHGGRFHAAYGFARAAQIQGVAHATMCQIVLGHRE